jgi:hypothetical protein
MPLDSGTGWRNFDGPIGVAQTAFSSVLEDIWREPWAISLAILKREF